MSRSYLDALSGQPLHPQAWAAMQGFKNRAWADPSLPHHEGRRAAQILHAARETAAAALDLDPSTVTFHPISTLSGLAVGGAVQAARANASQPSVITSRVERQAVLAACADASGRGQVTEVSVDSRGGIDLNELRAAITDCEPSDCEPRDGRPGSGIVVIQTANTELGTIQPLADVIEAANRHSMPVISDATGSVGLSEIPVGWSVLFAEAHTWGGPPGVGILAISNPNAWSPPTESNATEVSRSPRDSVSVLDAASAAAGLDAVARERASLRPRLHQLVSRIRTEVPQLIPDVDMLGDPEHRLPHIVTFSCLYADGERLAAELDRRGIAVGSGSACASRVGLPSHVLTAVGALTHGNIRISLPLTATSEDVDHLLRELPDAVAEVRRDAGMG